MEKEAIICIVKETRRVRVGKSHPMTVERKQVVEGNVFAIAMVSGSLIAVSCKGER